MNKTIYVSYMSKDNMYLFEEIKMPNNSGMSISEYCQSLPNYRSNLKVYLSKEQMNESMNQLLNQL